MSRKDVTESRNPGAEFGSSIENYFDGPELAQSRTSAVMVERVLLGVLRTEFNRLTSSTNVAEATRLFGHIFDPLAGQEEREEFVTHFQRRPPNVVLGYPRTTVELPIVSIVLGEESESGESVLSDYLGESLEGEKGAYSEYIGSHFDQTYHIHCYSDHPDVCAYLYHFTKLVLMAAKPFMIKAGLVDPRLSGGELSPDEGYVPENMFARVVTLNCQSLNSMPILKLDPSSFRVGGIFMNDVRVDGMRGAVTPYSESSENEE